ncbi:MAG: class GN sortase [Deinococcota bacterium]
MSWSIISWSIKKQHHLTNIQPTQHQHAHLPYLYLPQLSVVEAAPQTSDTASTSSTVTTPVFTMLARGWQRISSYLSWQRGITLVCLVFAGYHLGSASYIHAKAWLAQQLMARAWQQTQLTGEPHKPWPWADGHPVFGLRAPAQQEKLFVLAGASGRNLAFAPSHMLASPQPGEAGNSVIAGHRDTHFRFLRHVAVGDVLEVDFPDGHIEQFEIMTLEVADVRDSSLRLDGDANQLVLVTCYPLDEIGPTGPLRYVVTARAINFVNANDIHLTSTDTSSSIFADPPLAIGFPLF